MIPITSTLEVLGKGNKRRQIPLLKDKVLNSIRMFRSARGIDDIEAAEGDDPLVPTIPLICLNTSQKH